MAKPLVQLDEETRARLIEEIAEAGMGYFIVRGYLGNEGDEQVHMIGGDFFVVPIRHSEYFSLSDLAEGQPFPPEPGVVLGIGDLRDAKSLQAEEVSPPPGYVDAWGAIELFGTTTLKFPANFYRYVGTKKQDPAFVNGVLKKDTYLTSSNDRGYANSGFAAVGRYALPLPVPHTELYEYQFPAGTTILVGTAVPKFGQAGGGVEIKLTTDTTPTMVRHQTLPSF